LVLPDKSTTIRVKVYYWIYADCGKLCGWICTLFLKLLQNAVENYAIWRIEMTEKKWIFSFDEVRLAEDYVGGSWDGVRALLGGKGSGLADMT
jgi:hypothetical protein